MGEGRTDGRSGAGGALVCPESAIAASVGRDAGARRRGLRRRPGCGGRSPRGLVALPRAAAAGRPGWMGGWGRTDSSCPSSGGGPSRSGATRRGLVPAPLRGEDSGSGVGPGSRRLLGESPRRREAAPRLKVRPRRGRAGAGRCGCPWGALATPRTSGIGAGGRHAGWWRGGRGPALCLPPSPPSKVVWWGGALFQLKRKNTQTVLSLYARLFTARKLSYYRYTSYIWKSPLMYSSKIMSILFKCCGAITLAEGSVSCSSSIFITLILFM